MLVLDEHRMMGTTPEILDELKSLVIRDRNHPSVVLWSVGNEEWGLEWNVTGERLTAAMQAFVKRLDPTRRVTIALSGSGEGNSLATDVFGFNYYLQHDIDKMHTRFPDRPVVGTEESSSTHTRGIYFDDDAHQHLSAYDSQPGDHHASVEQAWNFHLSRPFSAGLFIWTGFDYRGEPTPFNWPAISSQFGLLDTCGFFKDTAYFAQSWWSDKPVVHLLPHWNWPGKEGQEINVQVYSNADQVELFLNQKSQGRKPMPRNSHLEWNVKYQPGTLLARGFKDGKIVGEDKRETTGKTAGIEFAPSQSSIDADGTSVSVIAVRVNDDKGRLVPNAGNAIDFKLEGPGKIIGVGNGDPSSHESDVFVDQVSTVPLGDWRVKAVDSGGDHPEVAVGFDDSAWQKASFDDGDRSHPLATPPQEIYRGSLEAPTLAANAKLTFMLRSLGDEDTIYVNGTIVARSLKWNRIGHEVEVDQSVLHPGKNVIAILTANTSNEGQQRASRAILQSGIGSMRVVLPAREWKRSAFNGLAEVILQSTQVPGEISLTASSADMKTAEVKIKSRAAMLPAAVPVTMDEEHAVQGR
jgi:beta-galactosidase